MILWGPNMCRLLDECDKRGIAYQSIHPSQFVYLMNQETGESVSAVDDPELSAVKWLEKLGNKR